MTHHLGTLMANWQNRLARIWSTQGPDTVHDMLNSASRKDLIALVMCNIGAQAQAAPPAPKNAPRALR